MGFYATDTLEAAPPPRTDPERARQHPVCGQKPLRGPIHNAISGYRYYNPERGRWINRDPIGELGSLITRASTPPMASSLHTDAVDMGTDMRAIVMNQVQSGDDDPNRGRIEEGNLYMFVLNNPRQYVDALGLCASRSPFDAIRNECRIALKADHGKRLDTAPDPPTLISHIDPNSALGKFAQDKTSAGYHGVGIAGCWVVATIAQVDALGGSVNWVNKYRGAGNSMTYREITAGMGEDQRVPGPGEPSTYFRRNAAEIKTALELGVWNMAQDLCRDKKLCCKLVAIETEGGNNMQRARLLPAEYIHTCP